MITIKKPEDMEKYYGKNTNTYRFVDKNGLREDVTIKFNIDIDSNIYAGNINARDIDAVNIDAGNINAWNINAWDIDAVNIDAGNIDAEDIDADHISYYAVCITYESFRCKSVKGRRKNAVHMCLDGDIEYKGE